MPNNDGNIVKRTSQYIDNMSFDETTGLPMVLLAQFDGTNVTVKDAVTAKRFDVASSPYIYIGEAALGADESSAVWTITRYDLTSGANYKETRTAYGTAVWTDRATETYL